MKNIFGNNKNVRICFLEAVYDKEQDDWFIEKVADTGQIMTLKKPTQEEICRELKLSRKNYFAHVSSRDIYVVSRNTGRPVACLKKFN